MKPLHGRHHSRHRWQMMNLALVDTRLRNELVNNNIGVRLKLKI